MSVRKLGNTCPVKYQLNGTGRDTYIFNNNGGFAIAEGSRQFCGYQKSFQNNLRVYCHPSNMPSAKIYGRRYSFTGGANANRVITTGLFAQNTLERSRSASRQRK